MADEFHQGGIIGGSWWNSSSSSRNMFIGGASSSLCSSPAANSIMMNDIGGGAGGGGGGFVWPINDLFPHDIVKTSRSSSDDRLSSNSASDGSILLQDVLKSQQPDNSTSTTSEWSQALFQANGSSSSNNYSSILQEDPNSGMNYRQQSGTTTTTMDNIQREWSPSRNYSSSDQDSSTTTSSFKPELLQNLGLESFTATCQGLTTNFLPLDSSSSSSCDYPSAALLQTLFDDDATPPHQKPIFDNHPHHHHQPLNMNFPLTSTTSNYLTTLNNNHDLPASLPKLLSPMLKQHQQQPRIAHQLPFSNNTPSSSWNNASAAALNDIRASLLMPSSTVNDKFNLQNLTSKAISEEVAKKGNEEPAFKRPRIETPSPLPTFKVRKEKLGDRITALQQLVSPFGKTDTASVLHEAIEYIKFLHDQVNVLSTPYMKNGSPGQRQQSVDNKTVEQQGAKQELRSRGLCLVPISSTFPVAAETTTDFWTPTLGGAFRSSPPMGQLCQKGEMGSMGWF